MPYSKILSIFDHVVRNPSTIKPNYQQQPAFGAVSLDLERSILRFHADFLGFTRKSVLVWPNLLQEIARARAAFLQVINEQPQARWWIDQRDRAGLGSFAEVYEKAYSEGNHD